jgi:hypothetical protein
MSGNVDKLQAMLEQATGPDDASANTSDPQAERLRETWLAFGQLLEAAQPATDVSLLPLGEEQGMRAEPRLVRPHLWCVTGAAALAASLLIGLATVWMLNGANRQSHIGADAQQTASNQPQSNTPAASTAWDDPLDQQIAELSQQLDNAKAGQLTMTDEFSEIQDRMKQFNQEVTADSL